MEEERQKKIKAGMRKLKEFQKKQKTAKKNVDSPSSPRSNDSASTKSADDLPESSVSSSTDSISMKTTQVPPKEDMATNIEAQNVAIVTDSLTTVKTSQVPLLENTDTKLEPENMDPLNEVKEDDDSDFVNADSELLSLFDSKIKKYQKAIEQKDSTIQKLTSHLESALHANELAESTRNLKQEFSTLQSQMKEASEMLDKQKLKNENLANESKMKNVCETGVQVAATELSESISRVPPSLEELLSKFKTPDLHEKLSNFLKSNSSEDELQYIVKELNCSALPEQTSSQTKKLQTDVDQNLPSDFPSISRKLETLNVVAKLIESLVDASTRYSGGSGDFSCSKFQSYFLKRLNSSETPEPYASESESVLSDMNYVEVTPVCEKSTPGDFTSIEKLRNKVVADDFSLVTDFLEEEMEKISVGFLEIKAGPQGDSSDLTAIDRLQTSEDSDLQKFILQKSKLEGRLQHLKKLDEELREAEHNVRHRSIESDTLTEDNILLEEPPLSCVSLLSLTDSEYRTEGAMTDSADFSRKVSLDMSRPTQERGFCTRCDKCYDLLQEKYDDHVCIFKEAVENGSKKLEGEMEKLRLDNEKQIELLCEEQELKLDHVRREYSDQVVQLRESLSQLVAEKESCLLKIGNLEEEIAEANKKIHELIEEKAEVVDLVQELQQDLEDLKVKSSSELESEKERLEGELILSLKVLKRTHEEEIESLKRAHARELEEKEGCLNDEHSRTVNMLEATHSSESASYQKKIEQLLEEKCELLAKTTQEYEAILKKNHKALVLLSGHLRTKLAGHREKMLDDSRRSAQSDLEVGFFDALDELNQSIEHGIVKFLNQSYFLADGEENFDETQYLPLEIKPPVSIKDLPPLRTENENQQMTKEEASEKAGSRSRSLTQLSEGAHSEVSLQSEDILSIQSELMKLQDEFQKDAAVYEQINAELHAECQALRQQTEELEEQKKKLETQLSEKDKELSLKETQLAAIDAGSVKHGGSGTQLSSTDLRSWQVDAAQTNSRLLHVLSDLVKTFLDIEHDINTHLIEHGLIPPRAGTLTHQDDETGHSVGSREDFTSLCVGDCPNIELAEDGPDLTPRAWDLYAAVGTYDTEIEGEDVVIGASRRLRLAVDHVLNLLTRAMNNQQNQDLKLLLKRNEELSMELQEESLGRDAVQMELVTAESNVRKLEAEKQRLEDIIRDLKETQEDMNRELCIERNKIAHLTQEKENTSDQLQTLKNHCELLASRLGDPERMGESKMSNASESCTNEQPELLQENSRLSNEKQTVQKNLSKERQSFLDRVQQLETTLEELRMEKEEVIEKKCKEIRDLKAEMEAMEKQLMSNKKFIDEQAQEREQEREEYIKEMNKMQNIVREKEKIQSNESQLAKEIESLDQLLQAKIEDHQNTIKKKENIENELRQSLDKNRDLRDIIEELEKQLDNKCKIVNDLQKKLVNLSESINMQEKINPVIDEGLKSVQSNGESLEHVENLKEQLACQSQEIEQMSLNQTLLHELRGQIHFLEAKVEQRARQLEAMNLSSLTSPVQSDDNSPGGSEPPPMQLPCEDGYEISPRSVHWLEIQRLEEKIGRLAHIDEELIRRNKELEAQLKRMVGNHMECQHENSALQEKLSEQLLQISVLKSHIEEQKHSHSPQKYQATNEVIEELHEAYEKQLENNNKLVSSLQELRLALVASHDEIQKKDELISSLQSAAVESKNQVQEVKNEKVSADSNESSCYKLMLLEKNEEIKSKTLEIEALQKELAQLKESSFNSVDAAKELQVKVKLVEELEKANGLLKSEVEVLKNEVESLQEQLSMAKEEIENEQARFESLCEEMANFSNNNPKDEQCDNPSKSESSSKPLEDSKAILTSKLVLYENQLREKNLEVSVLSATVAKLECSLRTCRKELEHEQVQVEVLLHELGSLAGYQKRLEEDYNVLQEMNQNKERELSILQEETEDQLKLEAEIESLEKELEYKQTIEIELKQKIKSLEANLEASQTAFRHENEQWKSRIDGLEKAHCKEIGSLKKQIKILRKNMSSEIEDVDLASIQHEIVEASKTFNTSDDKAYEDLIYALLKKAVDSELQRFVERHRSETKEMNESWQHKIESEMNSRCEKLEKENLLLKEKLIDNQNRQSIEKDELWQKKVSEIESSLKKKLREKHKKELNSLNSQLDLVKKEKESALAKLNDLSRELERVQHDSQVEQKELLKKLEAEKEGKLKDRKHSEMALRQDIEKLQDELNLKEKKEKRMESAHREEVADLHKFYENRWSDEMMKIQASQIEEFRKLKDSKEKNTEALCNLLFSQYEEKLTKLQEEFARERKNAELQHELDLQELRKSLEKRFEKEKQRLQQEAKEMEELANINGKHRGDGDGNRFELEKMDLMSVHEKELRDLRCELEGKYKRQLQEYMLGQETQMRHLEESYNRRIDEAHELIKEAKRVASRHTVSDSLRTGTPSSEMTSSDEACSSCQEDMLPGNKHILVNKIYQDGKRILSLMGNSNPSTSLENEARLWIEERQWIVNKVKSIVPDIVGNPGSLKLVISNLVDEIRNLRQSILNLNDDLTENNHKCVQLEQQYNSERSKLYVIAANLSQQTNLNKELEDVVNSKNYEIQELKKILVNENRMSSLNATEKEQSTQLQNENFSSNSIEYLRSAGEPRSMDRFSMFVPELSSVSIHKTPEPVEVTQDGIPSQWSVDANHYSESIHSPDNVSIDSKSDILKMSEDLRFALGGKRLDSSIETKLHGLYWMYKRSQSYNKSLVYQKNYLLKLLKGFQMTEKVTLAWLNHMGDGESPRSQDSESRLRGRSLFRAAAFVVVAVQRMKFCIHRWRLLAKVPSTQVVNAEVRTVFQVHSVFSPLLTPGDYYLSNISLSSKTASLDEAVEHTNLSHPYSDTRHEKVGKNKSTADKRQMTEYLQRLKSLQQQLGLDNFR